VTESFKPILDRQRAEKNAQGLIEVVSPMLREAINYSTWAFARTTETGAGLVHKAAMAAPVVLFRHVIEVADAIEVSLSKSCVDPARMMLRGLFEAVLALQYICENESTVERRALAWLYNVVHTRIRELERIKNGVLSKEMDDQISAEKNDEIDADLKRYRSWLDAPYMQEVVQEVKRQKKFRNWYSLWGGPNHLRELAEHLDQLDEYELLYRRWSSEAHASSGLRKTFYVPDRKGDRIRAVMPVRSPVNMKDVSGYTRSFLLSTLLAFVDRFRPGEAEARAIWHREVMMPLKERFREASFTFDVQRYDWDNP